MIRKGDLPFFYAFCGTIEKEDEVFRRKKEKKQKHIKHKEPYKFKKRSTLYILTIFFIVAGLYMGMQGTVGDKITPAEGKKIVSEGGLLIDISSEKMFNMGHLAGAENIPFKELETSDKLPEDLKKDIVIVGRDGFTTLRAKKLLIKKGYENVYDMGTMDSWR